MRNKKTTYKWAYLPFVFSSAAILATQATAGPAIGSQQYQDAKQVNRASHEYVGGQTQIGFGVTDDGDVDVEFNQVISENDNHSTGVGLWAGYDLKGDDKGILGRGAQLNHNWVSRDASGRAIRVNKVFGAYDRNEAGHDKATVGYGQENQDLFWEGHVSKGLSGRKDVRTLNNGQKVSDRAYDYGVGGSVGKYLEDSNTRIRAGLDHEWSDQVGLNEKDARNTTLSGGIEKFFQGTGHSMSLDVAASKQSGGYLDGGNDDTDVTGRLGYRYDFGGASIYQPDQRYRRVRVEVPGKSVPTYKTVPVYAKKTIRTPYKQLVKSTMELEGQTFFKLNSAKLIPSAQTRLKQVAAQIRKSGYKGSIRITGNTCGLGDPVYDQRLSEQRAKAVRNYLIKNGFNPDHLVARGLGKGHPKYPRTQDQDFKNRRVDIEYVSEKQTYKTGYKTEQKTVQTGTRKVPLAGAPGAPRVIWKTEAIPTSPAWIKRALHNNIKHDRNVNTFTTAEGFDQPVDDTVKAVNDTATTNEGEAVTIDVLGNDDGDATLTGVLTQPDNGSVAIVDGQIVYTPDAGFTGTDTFTYQITDPNGNLATATVTVTVNDDSVKAADDTATTNEGESVTIDVLGNDDGDATLTGDLTQPANGTVAIVDGQIVYTPDAGFTGTDTFTYQVTDPDGNLATATVTVTVEGDVKAANDSATTDEGEAVTIDVLGNDDADAEITRIVTGPLNGTVSIVGGQIVYTPDAGFTGTDTFTYEVTDPDGNLATATVTVTVNEVKDDEVKAADDSVTTGEGEAVTIDVLNNDDADAEITRIITGPSNGTVSIVGGQIVYTPDAGFTGTDTFTYEVTDPNGNLATATVTITVKDDSVKATNDKAVTDEGEAVTIDVLSNDDSDATLTGVLTEPSNGTATIVNGQIVYTPDIGFTGTDTFTYQVTDPNGNLATATVTVTVNDVNKPPVAVDDSASTGCNAITINVLDNDSDPDGDALSIIGVSAASLGTAVISGSTIVYTPSNTCGKGNTGLDTFTYTISDGNGGTATASVNVDVKGVTNGGTTNAEPDDVMTNEGESVSINVLANDTGSGLEIIAVDNPKNGTAVIVGDTIVYTPDAGFTGMDSFWYDIVDANGYNDSALIVVDVIKGCPTGYKCN